MAALDCVRPALRRRDAAPNAVPETPTRLAAVGGNGGLALSWALPTNTTNIDKLQLRWKASAALPFTASDAWTDLAGDATGHRVMGLTNDTAYSVELRAVNELGAGTAATVAGTPQNLVPSFGAATVADQTLSRDKAMPVLALPEASGGDGPLTYAIAPALPTGLSLDMATRTVSGAPYAQQAATTYSWTASDEDGDSASLSFSIAVEYDFPALLRRGNGGKPDLHARSGDYGLHPAESDRRQWRAQLCADARPAGRPHARHGDAHRQRDADGGAGGDDLQLDGEPMRTATRRVSNSASRFWRGPAARPSARPSRRALRGWR